MAKTVLLLMRTFYTEEKMMRMLDATGQVIFHQIKGVDLVESPEVFIESGSLFRDEAQDRDAKIMEMMQLGLISKEDAMQEMTLRTGSSFVTEKVQAISHAKDILEAAKRGFEVEIFRNDDVEAFLKVFGDFMREREYYALEQEQQEYIRDVYVSLVAANVPPEQYEMVRMADKVFPRKPVPGAVAQEQASLAVVQGSDAAQGQVLDETLSQASDIGIITGATGGGGLPQGHQQTYARTSARWSTSRTRRSSPTPKRIYTSTSPMGSSGALCRTLTRWCTPRQRITQSPVSESWTLRQRKRLLLSLSSAPALQPEGA